MKLSFKGKVYKKDKVDPKRNDEWFGQQLQKLGISEEKCQKDQEKDKYTAMRVTYSKLKKYKKALDKVDENKNPLLASRIADLISAFLICF